LVEVSPKFALNIEEMKLKIHPGLRVPNNMVFR
jgi:hypothetical protein